MPSPIKMRVLCSSTKPQIRTYAAAIGEACECLVSDVPPAYPCDKERLVVLVMSLNGAPNDLLRRFCMELNPSRAANVALVVDNKKQLKSVDSVKAILKEAGTNVLEDVYYLPSPGLFSGAKISLDQRIAIVKWVENIAKSIT